MKNQEALFLEVRNSMAELFELKPEEFQAVKTVQDVVDVLERLMAEQQKEQK